MKSTRPTGVTTAVNSNKRGQQAMVGHVIARVLTSDTVNYVLRKAKNFKAYAGEGQDPTQGNKDMIFKWETCYRKLAEYGEEPIKERIHKKRKKAPSLKEETQQKIVEISDWKQILEI